MVGIGLYQKDFAGSVVRVSREASQSQTDNNECGRSLNGRPTWKIYSFEIMKRSLASPSYKEFKAALSSDALAATANEDCGSTSCGLIMAESRGSYHKFRRSNAIKYGIGRNLIRKRLPLSQVGEFRRR